MPSAWSKVEQVDERIHEAERLRLNIDRRSVSVRRTLAGVLSEPELNSYDMSMADKICLVKDIRRVENELSLGNEILILMKNLKNL